MLTMVIRYLYRIFYCYVFFFFNDTATTEIYTLSLHDALPIWLRNVASARRPSGLTSIFAGGAKSDPQTFLLLSRSEEHTSELQSQSNLVCRLLLEKKKTTTRSPRRRTAPTTTGDCIVSTNRKR